MFVNKFLLYQQKTQINQIFMSIQSFGSSFLGTSSNISDTQQTKTNTKEMNLKFTKHESEDEEIARLEKQLEQSEKEFVDMEKYYQNKIKNLHFVLSEEDKKYHALLKSLASLKELTAAHKEKVEKILIPQPKPDSRQKNTFRLYSSKQKPHVKSSKVIDNSNPTQPDHQRVKVNSPSRKPFYKVPMFHKTSLNSNDSLGAKNNMSNDKNSKKSQEKPGQMSPIEKSQRSPMAGSSQKFKKGKGLGALKQKIPFK